MTTEGRVRPQLPLPPSPLPCLLPPDTQQVSTIISNQSVLLLFFIFSIFLTWLLLNKTSVLILIVLTQSTVYTLHFHNYRQKQGILCVLTSKTILDFNERRHKKSFLVLTWHDTYHNTKLGIRRKFLWRSWGPFFWSKSRKIRTTNTSPSRTVPSVTGERREGGSGWLRLRVCIGTSLLLSTPAEDRSLNSTLSA